MERLDSRTKQETGEGMLERLRKGSLEHQLVASLVDSLANADQAAAHAFACQKLRESTSRMIERCREDKGGGWLSHSYYLPIYKFYRSFYESCSQAGCLHLDTDNCLRAGRREIDFNPSQKFDMLVEGIGGNEADLPLTEPVFMIEYQEVRSLLLTEEEQPRKARLVKEYRMTAAAIKEFIDNDRINSAAEKGFIFQHYKQPLEQLAETCLDLALSMEYAHHHLAD
ncbi:MAG: hypothetical protein F4X83_00165 [Chloroflexi bacterium]|nr:hypothetical protein [Chloroflexota bacterium]